MTRRRIALQLTPLLDMLLIIIFAQFMEVKSTVDRSQSANEGKLKESVQREADLERRNASLVARNRELEQTLASSREFNEEFRRMRDRETSLRETLQLTVSQRDILARLAAELFRLPPSVIEKALRPGSESPLSDQEMESLRKLVQALAENRADAVARHLLTYSELLKRADIWEISLSDAGMATIKTAGATHQFRAETTESFSREVFDHYKTAPQPKGLVIILLSWGETPARWREAAIKGVRAAAERMRTDSDGRTRFEYAVLGHHSQDPTPPSP